MRYAVAIRTVTEIGTSISTNDDVIAKFEWFCDALSVAEFLSNKRKSTIVVLYKPASGEWGVLQSFTPAAKAAVDIDGVIPAGPDPYDGVPADTMSA